jgi:hypothetical protein
METSDPDYYRKYFTFSARVFQLSGGEYGVGLHSKNRGIVWRWDNGLLHKPLVVHWYAPHCDNDTCGSRCEHITKGTAQ